MLVECLSFIAMRFSGVQSLSFQKDLVTIQIPHGVLVLWQLALPSGLLIRCLENSCDLKVLPEKSVLEYSIIRTLGSEAPTVYIASVP